MIWVGLWLIIGSVSSILVILYGMWDNRYNHKLSINGEEVWQLCVILLLGPIGFVVVVIVLAGEFYKNVSNAGTVLSLPNFFYNEDEEDG